jgi:glutathione peroxidase
MKILSILIILTGMMFTYNGNTSVHSFTVKDIDGKDMKLESYKGKVVLIVNVASNCGYTKQYADLQKLYDQYKDKGLVVLGFPANNFGGQEPGSNEEIKLFCSEKYDVQFPMFSKVSVKGDDIHPLFAELTKAENPNFTGDINWNFEKFLVDKNGKLVHRFRSKSEPMSDEVLSAIKKLL